MTVPLQCPAVAAQRHQTRLDPQITGPGAAPAGPGPDYTLASAAATSLASSAAAAPVSAAAANGSATLLPSAPSAAAAANGGQQTHLGTQASVRFCEAPTLRSESALRKKICTEHVCFVCLSVLQ